MTAGRTSDPDADLFEATERRLEEWGRFCRASANALGVPKISNFAQIAEHARRQEREDRKKRRKALRQRIRQQQAAQQPVDCKDVAQAAGQVELDTSARGKHSLSMHSARITIPAEATKVEAAIRALQKWQQTPIYRTYLYQEPHRIAARELGMDVDTYRKRWEVAVREVGRILAMRESAAVRFPRPPVRVEGA